MARAKKNAIVKQTPQELAMASSFEDDSGSGFEEADQQSFAIPFVSILQSGSPQCKKSEGEYIKGAEEGMLFNSASDEVFDGEKGLLVIPCHYRRVFIEWKSRDDGGGFVAEHGVGDGEELLKTCEIDEKNNRVLPNGNHLSDTRVHYCLLVNSEGEAEPVVISMASTQIKKSRKWMTVMRQIRMHRADKSAFNPPMYSHTYLLTTVPESNDQGSWMGWKMVKEAVVANPDHYADAKAFRDNVVAGTAKATHQQEGAEAEEEFG